MESRQRLLLGDAEIDLDQAMDLLNAKDERIAELELMLIHRTKEVGNWILRYDKSVTKQREIIHGQKMRIVELEDSTKEQE
tara:strand:+ start:1805 stop:2047 length:243 start_codon:yes stop_codon:yes gene_type:complete